MNARHVNAAAKLRMNRVTSRDVVDARVLSTVAGNAKLKIGKLDTSRNVKSWRRMKRKKVALLLFPPQEFSRPNRLVTYNN